MSRDSPWQKGNLTVGVAWAEFSKSRVWPGPPAGLCRGPSWATGVRGVGLYWRQGSEVGGGGPWLGEFCFCLLLPSCGRTRASRKRLQAKEAKGSEDPLAGLQLLESAWLDPS